MKQMQSRSRTRTLFVVLGMVIGGTILHIYSMFTCWITMSHAEWNDIAGYGDFILAVMRPHMWPMAGLYVIFGGVLGYMIARLVESREDLIRKHATLETLENLTLTVTHYIRNANSTVGGYSRRLLMKSHIEDLTRNLEKIRNASDQIEAVVSALQTLDEKSETEEIGTTHLRMLNIGKLIEQQMALLREEQGSYGKDKVTTAS